MTFQRERSNRRVTSRGSTAAAAPWASCPTSPNPALSPRSARPIRSRVGRSRTGGPSTSRGSVPSTPARRAYAVALPGRRAWKTPAGSTLPPPAAAQEGAPGAGPSAASWPAAVRVRVRPRSTRPKSGPAPPRGSTR
ncbi:hypothetical protein AMK15_35700 [Streptomyces sp. MJM1172]|nr:hypothetical protein AMK15_35700 [Streptomyces sp. MJM1172]